jgi:hypothetical protein
VADLLVAELGGDLGGAEVERRLPGPGGTRPAGGEVAVQVVDAAAQRGVQEPLRLHELGVEQELQLLHVARVHRQRAAPRRRRPAPRVLGSGSSGRSSRRNDGGGGERQEDARQDEDYCGIARARHGWLGLEWGWSLVSLARAWICSVGVS